MSLAIINNTGVITFNRDQQFFFIAKTSIKSISLIRDEIIKLETDLCVGSIYIRYKDVIEPITFMPIQLMSYLRYWIVDLQVPGPNQ